VGRHEAGGGGTPHPVVAAALARRPARTGPRHLDAQGAIGWPGPPSRTGGGLGWPGDLAGAAEDGSASTEEPAPAPSRTRWPAAVRAA
jgi:hypothetical protein